MQLYFFCHSICRFWPILLWAHVFRLAERTYPKCNKATINETINRISSLVISIHWNVYPIFTCSFLHLGHRSHNTWESVSSSLFYDLLKFRALIQLKSAFMIQFSDAQMSIGQHALFSTPTCWRNPMMHPVESHQYCKTAIKYVISYRRIGASREEHGNVGKWTVESKPGKVFKHCFVLNHNKVRIIIQLQAGKFSCCIYGLAALWMIISMAPSSREI